MSNESMNPDRGNESPPERNQPAAGRTAPVPVPPPSSERNQQSPGRVASSKPVQAPRFPPSSRKTGPIQKPLGSPAVSKGASSQAGLAGVRMGASMSGMRPNMAPKVAPAKPRPTRGLVQRTHDPIASRPINKGPQPDPDIIDRVPSQEELVARSQEARDAGSRGFEAQEGETTAGATARGFSEGLASAGSVGGMMARGAGAAEAQEPSGASGGDGARGAAVEDRLEKRPWLKDIVDQTDAPQQDAPQQDGELER